MEILNIKGNTDENGVMHELYAHPTAGFISILGYDFNDVDIVTLANWIVGYQANYSDPLTLRYLIFNGKSAILPNLFPLVAQENPQQQHRELGSTIPTPYVSIFKVLATLKNFNFLIEGDGSCPQMEAVEQTGYFKLSGRFITSATYETFRPALSWFNHYMHIHNRPIRLDIMMDTFNTSAGRLILDLLSQINSYPSTQCRVHWYYHEDDEDMEEAGEEFRELSKLGDKMIITCFGE